MESPKEKLKLARIINYDGAAISEEIPTDLNHSEPISTKKLTGLKWDRLRDLVNKVYLPRVKSSQADIVKVNMQETSYLQEAATNTQTIEDSSGPVTVKILKMNAQQRLEHQLIYNNGLLKLNGKVEDTTNKFSKKRQGIQAFVLAKTGELYIGEHRGGYSRTDETLVHGSFLDDSPAEMAGMLGITNGKITMLSNDSGHYKPQELDIYRGIKALEEQMPDVFAPGCIIKMANLQTPEYQETIAEFKQRMERIMDNGVPYHEYLRNERLKAISNYKEYLVITPIFRAIEEGNVAIVQRQLDNGIDINTKDKDGLTLLHHACASNNTEVVALLISRGSKIQEVDNNKQTAFHIACSNGNLQIAQLLAEKSDINAQDNHGMTPFLHACYEGKQNIAKFLLDKGVLVDTKDSNGMTALHHACNMNNPSMIKFLLTNNANIIAKDNSGMTALHYACIRCNKAVIESLIAKGVPIDEPDNNGRTSFHHACASGNIAVAKLLLEKNIDLINKKDKDGKTALHYACSHGHESIVEFLLDKNIELINQRDNSGRTAFHYASANNHVETIDILKDNNATTHSLEEERLAATKIQRFVKSNAITKGKQR